MSATRGLVLATIAHAALLVAPVAVCGRARALARPGAAAVVVVLLAFAVVEARAARRGDPSRFGAPGTRLALASALALLVTGWLAIGAPSAGGVAALVAGGALAGAGVALRAAAIRALGDAFTSETVLVPGRALVGRGLYARLRHPSEVGLVLVAFGVAILGSSRAAAVAAVVVLATSGARIAKEEELLRARALAGRGQS